jgi:hypothetical protein
VKRAERMFLSMFLAASTACCLSRDRVSCSWASVGMLAAILNESKKGLNQREFRELKELSMVFFKLEVNKVICVGCLLCFV